MAHINPTMPYDGQPNWSGTADAYLLALTNQINAHDDLITNLATNGAGGSGLNVVDNGDNTITILPSTGTPGGSTGTNTIAFDTDGTPYVTG